LVIDRSISGHVDHVSSRRHDWRRRRLRPDSPWRFRGDVWLVLTLAIASFFFIRWYTNAYRAAGGVPAFHQDAFGPAVILACGRDFVTVTDPPREAPALDAFLRSRSERFDCRDLPAAVKTQPLTPFQGASRLMLVAASLVWRNLYQRLPVEPIWVF